MPRLGTVAPWVAAVALAVAGAAIPALPAAIVGGDVHTGYARVQTLAALLLPPVFPLVALAQRRLAPWPRRFLLVAEAFLSGLGTFLVWFELTFVLWLELVLLPGAWATLAVHVAALATGLGFGWGPRARPNV